MAVLSIQQMLTISSRPNNDPKGIQVLIPDTCECYFMAKGVLQV